MEIQRPLKAIRSKCLDCSGGQPKEVRYCQVSSCALWPYRMGKRPGRNQSGCQGLEMAELEKSIERT